MNNIDEIKWLSNKIDNTRNRVKNLESRAVIIKKKRKKIYLPIISVISTGLFAISGLGLGALLWALLGEAVLYIRFKLQKEDLIDEEEKTKVELEWLKKQLRTDYNRLDFLVASKKKDKNLSTPTAKGDSKSQLRRLKSEVQLLKYQQTHPVKEENKQENQEEGKGYSYIKR